MVFSSTTFLFLFLPIVLGLNYLVKTSSRNLFLTVSSLVFYAWGEKQMVMLMLFSIAMNYLGGILIEKKCIQNRRRSGKFFLGIFISINLLLLGYYKYVNFFIASFNLLGPWKIESLGEIILPIGISFFTFQGMSYLIDVYQQKVKAQYRLISLALYISMFPQLIAGPIVRYIDVAKQIDAPRFFKRDQFSDGIVRFVIGLFKKVIIANQMGFMADEVFGHNVEVGTPSLWIGIIAYTFQIYFDFSGYSDMAIGLGKMFGFDFLENFNYPYISKSIQEFWRRWHISLSTWFKDYLYIPLGGNRRGHIRTYRNLILVFLVTGLWHGASWNFVFWGLFHGFFLIVERLGFGIFLQRIPAFLRHFYTLLVVLIGWVFFRAETLTEALVYVKGLFVLRALGNDLIYQYVTPYFIFVGILAVILSTGIKVRIFDIFRQNRAGFRMRWLGYTLVLFLFLISLLELAESNYNPFIYFRF